MLNAAKLLEERSEFRHMSQYPRHNNRGRKPKPTNRSGAAFDVEDFEAPRFPLLEPPIVTEVTSITGMDMPEEQKKQILALSALGEISDALEREEQEMEEEPEPKKSGFKERLKKKVTEVAVGEDMEHYETETTFKTPLGQITRKYRKKDAKDL
jgi:hypothetical protein